MASTEAPAGANAPLAPAGANAPMIDIGAPEPHYPVDDVQDSMKECELYQPMRNMSWKVAIGTALPCKPGALHHGNPIAAGYARVTVDDVVEGYEDLEIDYATPEGDVRLGDVKRQIILWQKKYIKFPGSAPRPPTPRNHPTSPPPSGGGGAPTPPSRQPTPPPIPPSAGKQPPPPSPLQRVRRHPVHLRRRSRSRGLRRTARQPPPGLLTRSLMYLRPQGYQCLH